MASKYETDLTGNALGWKRRAGKGSDEVLRRCIGCSIWKPLSSFRQLVSRKGRESRLSKCKICIQKSEREKYRTNIERRESNIRMARVTTVNIRRYIKKWLDDLRESRGCQVCNEKTRCCIDFHHVEPRTAMLAKCVTYKRTERELAKCVSLCANCHKKVHAGIIDDTKLERCIYTIPRLDRPIGTINGKQRTLW